MRDMVAAGEVDALVPERVWQEIARGLMEATPSRMLRVLRDCGALARLLPELDQLFGVPQPEQHHPEVDTGAHVLLVIDAAAGAGLSLAARTAALLHDLGKGATAAEFWPRHHGHEGRGVARVQAVCARLRAPADCRDLAVLVARDHGNIHRAFELRPATVLELLERCDALRRPDRFVEALAACAADFHGRLGWQDRPYPQADFLKSALASARAVDAGAIARQTPAPAMIPEAIRLARIAAIAAVPKEIAA
jgi:tRNA nucleotidyltransferase (CCA-adding enzyme)